MISVDSIIAQVAQLSDDERKELFERLKAQGAALAEHFLASPTITGEWYRHLSETACRARDVRYIPLNVFRGKKGWPAFARAAESAEKLVEELIPKNDRVRRLAFRVWCSKLIVLFLMDKNMTLSTSSLTWGLECLSAILDAYFPGYRVSGLMPIVLERLFAGTDRKLLRIGL